MPLQKLFGPDGVYSDDFITLTRAKCDLARLALIKAQVELKSDNMQICKIDDLHVDLEAQRHSGMTDQRRAMTAAMKVIENFDINAFELVSVSIRSKEGKKAGVDGIHRTLVAHIAGADRIPADQWVSPGEKYDASVFMKMNTGRRGVSSTIKTRTQAIVNPNSAQAWVVKALRMAFVHPDTDTFKGLNALVKVQKTLAKAMSNAEAASIIAGATTAYGMIWNERSIEQEIVAAITTLFSKDKMTNIEQDLFMKSVEKTFPQANDLLVFAGSRLGGGGHNHGQRRIEEIERVLHSHIPPQKPQKGPGKAKGGKVAPTAPAQPSVAQQPGNSMQDAMMILNVLKDGPKSEQSILDFLKGEGTNWPLKRVRAAILWLGDNDQIVFKNNLWEPV